MPVEGLCTRAEQRNKKQSDAEKRSGGGKRIMRMEAQVWRFFRVQGQVASSVKT